MSKASEEAGAFLTGGTPRGERPSATRGATGDYARLADLLTKDDLSDAETDEFNALAEKRRAGTLDGTPRRTVLKRQSVGGERELDLPDKAPKTASDIAAAQLLRRGL